MAKNDKSAEKVTVACKLPNGIILRVFDFADGYEPVLGGGQRKTRVAHERQERAFVQGNTHPQNAAPHCTIVGGYAITPGIDKRLWDLWLEQNKESAIVTENLIFAHNSVGDASAESEERTETTSGLERIDSKNLPKGIKPATAKEV